MINLQNTLKNLDMFGYEVHLNFDKRSNLHSTIIGGVFTTIMYFIMIFYFIYGFHKITDHK